MPVGANVRIAATPLDLSAATPPEGGSIEELFGGIIASLGDAAAAPASVGLAATPEEAIPGEATPPSGDADADVSAMIEQLLALAGRGPSKAVPGKEPAQPEKADEESGEQPDLDKPVASDPVVVLPLALGLASEAIAKNLPLEANTLELSTIQQPASPDQPQLIAGLQPDLGVEQVALEQGGKSEARPRPITKAQTEGLVPQVPVTQIDNVPVQPRPIAASRTDAAVQQAFSSLEAIMKDVPPQALAASLPGQPKQDGERDPVAALQDLKVGVMAPLAQMAAALDPARPADTVQALSPRVDTAELVVERQLDMAHEGEWLDRLAKDIAQTAGTDKNPLRFRLNPETLGTLRVEITQERHGAAVRLTADTETARSIIADAQPRLIAEARAQGIRISEAHVDLGSQAQSGDPRRQNPAFEEPTLRTARSLRDEGEGDGKPTPGRSERYA